MANVTFQPMNFGVDTQNPSAVYNPHNGMNPVMNSWFPQTSPSAQYEPQLIKPFNPQFSSPQMGRPQMFNSQAPQIAYVPVFVDSQGRPLLQNYLPTVGLNQFMQAPQMNFIANPQSSPKAAAPAPIRSNSPSFSSNSDSGSSCGSVSPSPKPQVARRNPPALNMDVGKETWADISERRFAADRRNAEALKRSKADPNSSNRNKKKRFGYRSKQNKIDTVYDALVQKYTAIGTLFDQDDVLRGPSVIRLHVKKYDALCSIEDALQAVETTPGMKIDGVSIPLSMKNTFQKKGFLVYFRLTDVNMVERAQEILRTFPEFKKCDVANIPSVVAPEKSAPTQTAL